MKTSPPLSTMPPLPPAPMLPEELLEQIFIRFPPDEPELLVRASLASKLWLGLLTGPRFRGQYRELHGSPPMLGFFCRSTYDNNPAPRFVSTGKFSARFPQDTDPRFYGYDVWDCRHGRVLLGNLRRGNNMGLAVWDPLTGRHKELDAPKDYDSLGAAVLCPVTGCDHKACHDGPFQVVVVGLDTIDGGCVACAQVFLPQVGEWSKRCSHLDVEGDVFIMPPVLIEDALYFMLLEVDDDDTDDGEDDDDDDDDDLTILKYELGSNCLSLIDPPLTEISTEGDDILMAMEDGRLGLARVNMLTIYLWSRQMGSNGVESWSACRVIDLHGSLSIQNPKKELRLIGSVEGSDIIFVTTNLGIYKISLKSLELKKIWKIANFYTLIPYMIFYDPLERANPCDVAH
ncbi:unnamed protein product [Alopecurus aequalis]